MSKIANIYDVYSQQIFQNIEKLFEQYNYPHKKRELAREIIENKFNAASGNNKKHISLLIKNTNGDVTEQTIRSNIVAMEDGLAKQSYEKLINQ